MISSATVLSLFVCVGLTSGQILVSETLLGSKTQVPTNDATVIDLIANFAVSQLGTEYALGQVISAEQQVIAGTLYFFKTDEKGTQIYFDPNTRYHLKANVKRTDAFGETSSHMCVFEILKPSRYFKFVLHKFACIRAGDPFYLNRNFLHSGGS